MFNIVPQTLPAPVQDSLSMELEAKSLRFQELEQGVQSQELRAKKLRFLEPEACEAGMPLSGLTWSWLRLVHSHMLAVFLVKIVLGSLAFMMLVRFLGEGGARARLEQVTHR